MKRWTQAELRQLRRLAKTETPVAEYNIPGRSTAQCYTAMKRYRIVRKGKTAKDGRRVRWTRAELQELRSQAKTATAVTDFSIPGKTYNAIETKLRALKLHPSDWTKPQLASLRTQALAAESVADITIAGKRRSVVQRKLRDLGIKVPRPWTEAERAALKTLFESGAAPEAWQLPNRSMLAMLKEGKRLGYRRAWKQIATASKRTRRPWTHRELALLRAAVNKALAPSEIQIPGRSVNAVRTKAARLEIIGDGVSRAPWPTEQEEELRNYRKQGLGVSAILSTVTQSKTSLLKGKSRTAIQKKLSRLGLAEAQFVIRAKNAVRLDAETLETLHGYLRRYARKGTPEQLALSWNDQMEIKITRRKVIYHLTQLGIKPTQKEVRKMPFSKAKQRARSKKQVAASAKRWRAYRKEQKLQLATQAEECRREAAATGRVLEERYCQNPRCHTRYPAQPPFFHQSQKRRSNGVLTTTLGPRCRICENQRRRAVNKDATASSTKQSSSAAPVSGPSSKHRRRTI